MPNLAIDPSTTGDITRAAFPRQLIVYDSLKNEWAPCVDEEVLASLDYLAISYRQTDFPDKEKLEATIRNACDHLNLNAYWLDFVCTGATIEEKNKDLFRIADVFRGAKKTLVLISGNDRKPQSPGWLNWGERLWTLPEALLSQVLLVKVGSRRIEEVSLRQLANHAYKDREEEMMLIDGYSGKDPLPLPERMLLLRKALWKRSNGPSHSHGNRNGSVFDKYPAERVYALMGFMQYRILPDQGESEEAAMARLITVNKLDDHPFSWNQYSRAGAELIIANGSSTDSSTPSPSRHVPQPTQNLPLTIQDDRIEIPSVGLQQPEEPPTSSPGVDVSRITSEDVDQANPQNFTRFIRASELSGALWTEDELPADFETTANIPVNWDKSVFLTVREQIREFIREAQEQTPDSVAEAFYFHRLSKVQQQTLLGVCERHMTSRHMSDIGSSYARLKHTLLQRCQSYSNESDQSYYMADGVLEVIQALEILCSDTVELEDWLEGTRRICAMMLVMFQNRLGDCGAIRREDCLQICEWRNKVWKSRGGLPGNTSIQLADRLEDVAMSYFHLGKLMEAESKMEEAVISRRGIGVDYSLARALMKHGLILICCERYRDGGSAIVDATRMNYEWLPGPAIAPKFQNYARTAAQISESMVDLIAHGVEAEDREQVIPIVLRLLRQLSFVHIDIGAALSISLQKIAEMFLRQSDSGSALQFAEEAQSYNQSSFSVRRPELLAMSSETISKCCLANKEITRAKIFIQQAIKVRQKLPRMDVIVLAADYEELSRINYQELDFNEAHKAISEAVKLFRKHSDMDRLRLCLKNLAKCAKKLGLIDEAMRAESEAKKL